MFANTSIASYVFVCILLSGFWPDLVTFFDIFNCFPRVWVGSFGFLVFFRKLSELGSRLDFGVQGLGRVLGAAAGRKWSFRVRRMSISLRHGFPVLS